MNIVKHMNAHWAYWPTDAQYFWQGCRPVDPRKRCDTPKWDCLYTTSITVLFLLWTMVRSSNYTQRTARFPILPSISRNQQLRKGKTIEQIYQPLRSIFLCWHWGGQAQQDAAHDTECTHVKHVCETDYLNSLVYASPVTVPYRTSALQTVACRKGVECKVWSGVECRVLSVECGVSSVECGE